MVASYTQDRTLYSRGAVGRCKRSPEDDACLRPTPRNTTTNSTKRGLRNPTLYTPPPPQHVPFGLLKSGNVRPRLCRPHLPLTRVVHQCRECPCLVYLPDATLCKSLSNVRLPKVLLTGAIHAPARTSPRGSKAMVCMHAKGPLMYDLQMDVTMRLLSHDQKWIMNRWTLPPRSAPSHVCKGFIQCSQTSERRICLPGILRLQR